MPDGISVHLQENGENNIVPHQLESGIVHELRNVRLSAGKKIVQADHFMPVSQESYAQV